MYAGIWTVIAICVMLIMSCETLIPGFYLSIAEHVLLDTCRVISKHCNLLMASMRMLFLEI